MLDRGEIRVAEVVTASRRQQPAKHAILMWFRVQDMGSSKRDRSSTSTSCL